MNKELLKSIEDWNIFCEKYAHLDVIESPIEFPCIVVYSFYWENMNKYINYDYIYLKDFSQ